MDEELDVEDKRLPCCQPSLRHVTPERVVTAYVGAELWTRPENGGLLWKSAVPREACSLSLLRNRADGRFVFRLSGAPDAIRD